MAIRDKRLFMTFPIDIHRHPKVSRLPVEVRWAFIEMNGEARIADNDGVFAADEAEFMWSREYLDALVSSHPSRPLVLREGETYRIREFGEHQDTRADREERSARNTANGSRGGRPPKNRPETGEKPTGFQDESVAQADGTGAKAEIETDLDTPSSTKKVSASRRKPEVPLPDDWTPKPSHVKLAAELGVDGRREEAQFRDHAAANDRRQREWDAAFRSWLRNARPVKLAPTARAQRTVMLATDLLEVEA